jgi:hypothetical protein
MSLILSDLKKKKKLIFPSFFQRRRKNTLSNSYSSLGAYFFWINPFFLGPSHAHFTELIFPIG